MITLKEQSAQQTNKPNGVRCSHIRIFNLMIIKILIAVGDYVDGQKSVS